MAAAHGQWLAQGLVAAWAILVALEDWRSRRIRNVWLLIPLCAVAASLWIGGRGPLGAGALESVAAAGLAAGCWLPGYWLRQLGAGDVKFAACIGLLLSPAAAVDAMLVAAVVLGVLAAAAKWGAQSSARLPAALALSAGLLVRLGWGPLWMG